MIYIRYGILIIGSVLFSLLLDYMVFVIQLNTYNPYKKYYKKYLPIRKRMMKTFISNFILYIIPFIWLFYDVLFYKGVMCDMIFPFTLLYVSNIIACLTTPSDVILYMDIMEYNGKIDLDDAKREQLI